MWAMTLISIEHGINHNDVHHLSFSRCVARFSIVDTGSMARQIIVLFLLVYSVEYSEEVVSLSIILSRSFPAFCTR